MLYVGLTNDPQRRCREHGSPADWRIYGPFTNEYAAREWEKNAIAAGYRGGTGGDGWLWGYTYSVTPFTKQ